MKSFSRRIRARACLIRPPRHKEAGRRSADRRTNHCPRHAHQVLPLDGFGRGRRPPFPPPRAGEGRGRARLSALHRGAAKAFTSWLSFGPRFLGFGTGLTVFNPLQRAPRGPVLVPAGRGLEAARERGYESRPRAPHSLRFRDRLEKRPRYSMSEIGGL